MDHLQQLHRGSTDHYEHPSYRLFISSNTFTLTPLSKDVPQKSLIIDRKACKIEEVDLMHRDKKEAGQVDCCGVLGIMNILGIEHLMVIVDRDLVGYLAK